MVYPRVGGGNSQGYPPAARVRGLSPRGRGKLPRHPLTHAALRSIPAWAGETTERIPEKWQVGVYPRVGGGNILTSYSYANAHGLSPRGRGKPRRTWQLHRDRGSIPAWAGETDTTMRIA